eukprot:5521974-Prymnesium_polylepis.1
MHLPLQFHGRHRCADRVAESEGASAARVQVGLVRRRGRRPARAPAGVCVSKAPRTLADCALPHGSRAGAQRGSNYAQRLS